MCQNKHSEDAFDEIVNRASQAHPGTTEMVPEVLRGGAWEVRNVDGKAPPFIKLIN